MTALPVAAAPALAEARWKDAFVGVDTRVPVAGGDRVAYVNLDNAASTPPLRAVQTAVLRFGEWYASVHRGAGYKSQLATQAYEEARSVVAAFLGVDSATQTVVFVKHATEAINLVARKLRDDGAGPVLTTVMEHHANLLPWRHHGPGELLVGLDAAGHIDLAAMERILAEQRGRVCLVAVTGASNVSGQVTPIHDIAALAHRHGARILVDAAQLAPHRRIDLRPAGDPGHIDLCVLSAHKMYAPYGSGVLVAPRRLLEGVPPLAGGGAVEVVTAAETVWSAPPESFEAGSPNLLGAIALAVAMRSLEGFGMEAVADHERALTRRLLEGLASLPGVQVLGHRPEDADGLGVVSFTVAGIHHALVAAALSWEWGISVRHGCFCAHPYLLDLLGVAPADVERARAAIVAGDKRAIPGAVRASFAPYSSGADVDRLLEALRCLLAAGPSQGYLQERSGDFVPIDGGPHLPSISELLATAS